MSPIMFLLAFNHLLQLAAELNCSHGYVMQLPLQHLEDLPPVDSTVYVKWVEHPLAGSELLFLNIFRMVPVD